MFFGKGKDKKDSIEDFGRSAGAALGTAIGGALGSAVGTALGFGGKVADAFEEKIDDAKEVIKIYNERQEQKKLAKLELEKAVQSSEENHTKKISKVNLKKSSQP